MSHEIDRVLFWILASSMMVVQTHWGSTAFFASHFPVAADPDISDALKHLWNFLVTVAAYGVVPALFVSRLTGQTFRNLGFQLGDWATGARIVLGACVVLPAMVWVSSHDSEFLRQYPQTLWAFRGATEFALWALAMLAYYVAWEFFFRGFLLQGLIPRMGVTEAILVQTALSTIVHIGKPGGEIWAAIPGGIFLGWLAIRTRSLLYPVLFHWILGLLNIVFCYHG
jgi:membrane protease YdiL (CAAX protease family)